MPLPRMTTRRWMFAVALVAFLLGCAVGAWRRYQEAEFAREYSLGWLDIRSANADQKTDGSSERDAEIRAPSEFEFEPDPPEPW
jgi:hypothetical protein